MVRGRKRDASRPAGDLDDGDGGLRRDVSISVIRFA